MGTWSSFSADREPSQCSLLLCAGRPTSNAPSSAVFQRGRATRWAIRTPAFFSTRGTQCSWRENGNWYIRYGYVEGCQNEYVLKSQPVTVQGTQVK
ncbi:hypothetical protein DPMN_110921 [Dreissena polymorpha]|uniref:Uncharacterized protein n=1 Tax=Dreissena polymorpha TaxID=45954 RepID=A0A9D4KDP0_DREPO|nr:hypothetical protein DPMN_110918 [Dreissena polymorpha]KAH3837529.1 hypothetical protein DPMN_110921 [Dreissena polymorpha]